MSNRYHEELSDLLGGTQWMTFGRGCARRRHCLASCLQHDQVVARDGKILYRHFEVDRYVLVNMGQDQIVLQGKTFFGLCMYSRCGKSPRASYPEVINVGPWSLWPDIRFDYRDRYCAGFEILHAY